MGVDVEIDSGGEFMLEMASAALCDGGTLGGLYDDALDLAVGALRYRAKLHREKADDPPEGVEFQADKWREWGADDAHAADLLERLLELGREQVAEIEGLSDDRVTLADVRECLPDPATERERGENG